MIKAEKDAARSSIDLRQTIQLAVDAVAEALPASFILIRNFSFGRPEPLLRAWTPGSDAPPLELPAPASKVEQAVYSEQRPIFIEDLRAERSAANDLRPLVERLGARSIYLSPVIYGGQMLALVGLVEADAPRAWTEEERQRLSRLAETVAPIIANAQLQETLRSYVEDILMLLRLAGEVASESDLDRALRAVLDSCSKILGVEAAAILRWDEDAKLLRLAAVRQLPAGILELYAQGVPLTDAVCGLAVSRRAGVSADIANDPRLADLHAAARWSGLRGVWATPIHDSPARLLGVLLTFSRAAAEVSPEKQRLADLFTRPAAVAMQNRERHLSNSESAEQFKRMEEKLRQSEQHRREFMSIISHELRTPLNAIIGYAQMLTDGFSGELNEQQRADVQTIVDSADRLLRMVEDTLDLARIDTKRFPVFMDRVAFDEVIRRAIAAVEPAARNKGLEIEFEIAETAPAVRTDPERVRQVLTNLLSNAVKFTDSGSIRIGVEDVEVGRVQFSITDTGIGFDTAAFPHIFEEFRQVDASTTRTHGGTGLGLAVSKRLVERLGGTIGVTSTPGEGSTFWFRLPPEIPGEEEQG
ncbi:MAG TPA: GAF domain-containing sensor histidine kinase [Pyrinomonadaceae bacterium]|jgi:signal transduction histidine kinase